MNENLKTIGLGVGLAAAIVLIGFLGFGHGLQYLGVAPATVPTASEVGLGEVDPTMVAKISFVLLLVIGAISLFMERDERQTREATKRRLDESAG